MTDATINISLVLNGEQISSKKVSNGTQAADVISEFKAEKKSIVAVLIIGSG